MKAFKVESLVIDFEGQGVEGIKREFERSRYSVQHLKSYKEVDIGEWHDDHPLNKRDKCDEEYKRLFPDHLQESWMKLFGTISDIAVASGMNPKLLAGIAESIACDMGDGQEILDFVKSKLEEAESFRQYALDLIEAEPNESLLEAIVRLKKAANGQK